MKEPSFELLTVTPKLAGDILDRHYKRIEEGKFKQRSISQGRIVKYAADMANGDWLLSPEPIAFDVNDDLIDGQHRLEAVRKSGVPVPMMVSYGWPVTNAKGIGTMDVIGAPLPRTIAALMQMKGVTNAANYASAVRFAARVAHSGNSHAMGIAQTMHFLEKENLREAIDRIVTRTSGKRDFTGRYVGPLAYYFTARPNKALAFAEGFFRMEFEKRSAIQAYVQWEKNKSHPDTGLRLKALCSAIRSWDEGKEVEVIKPTVEAVEWLSNQNPKLRASFRELCPRLK